MVALRGLRTLQELPLGRDVHAVVEQLAPLLAEVVAEGADAAVEDAGLMVSCVLWSCVRFDLQALDGDVGKAEDGHGRRV